MTKPRLLNHSWLFLTGIYLLAVGLPVSKFLTSFSQLILLASFFLEGSLRSKWQRLLSSPSAWIIAGIWFMHVIGLLYTDNIQAGTWDLRMKIPILVVTLVVAANAPLAQAVVRNILWIFTAAVFAGTAVSTAVLAGIVHHPVNDIRDIFIFHISHIRFALFTCLVFYFLGWRLFVARPQLPMLARAGIVLLMAWLVVFLVLAESMTGLSILAALLVPALLALAWQRRSMAGKVIVLAVAVLVPLTLGIKAYIFLEEINTVHIEAIDTSHKTALGNPYQFNTLDSLTENGYRVWIYYNDEEMRTAWNERSSLPFDSLDRKSQPLRITLFRYLTSKGEKKDAEAVRKLSEEDVRDVELGVANVLYRGTSNFKARLLELNWEFQQARYHQAANGHSMAMRIEFWKTGLEILKKHLWTGVGTGDLQSAYNAQYEEMHSRLHKEWRLRAHDQYLSIALAFGIFGLAYFLFALFYPMLREQKTKSFLYWIFLGIFLLSMLTEDTLETPAGSSFFALFNALFLFAQRDEEN